jgi:hypothetical protein
MSAITQTTVGQALNSNPQIGGQSSGSASPCGPQQFKFLTTTHLEVTVMEAAGAVPQSCILLDVNLPAMYSR